MKKHIALVLLLVAAMLLGSIGSVGLAETQSTNVVIWAFADPHARYFEYIAEKYTELHPDVTFTVELMDLTALNDRLAIVIGGGGEGSPDLVDIEQGSPMSPACWSSASSLSSCFAPTTAPSIRC